MNRTSPADDTSFREEVRTFLKQELPADLANKVRLNETLGKQDYEFWQNKLNSRGWLAPNWPRRFGGAEWNPLQLHIFAEECAMAFAPRVMPFGITMLGPVLQKFGTKAQQDYWLPRILSGEDWWCQGYSEPNAGSDLASLQTRAERRGNSYIVNGQKTWTSYAQHASMMFCLVRTDPGAKQQSGISFLLIDMKSPGIQTNPIRLLDKSAEVNEVWFKDVRVPAENLVGEENQGWTYAKYLLTHERTNISGIGFSQAGLADLKRIAKQAQDRGRPLLENPHFAARVAQVEIDLLAMSVTNLRLISNAAKGQAPGIESSLLKIKGTQIRQEITDLARRAAGPAAQPFANSSIDNINRPLPDPFDAGRVAASYFNNRKLSIFGGSNEIQREIYSKALLKNRQPVPRDQNLTEEQSMLKDMLERFFSDPPENTWQSLAELGIIGALFKEKHGGYGGTGTDIAIVFERIGRVANTTPLIDCALIPGCLLAAADKELVPLIAGETRYAVAHSELNARYDLHTVDTAYRNGTITGEKTLVVGAEDADHFIVSAGHENNINLYIVSANAPGIRSNSYELAQGGCAADLMLSSTPAKLLLSGAIPALEAAQAAAVVAQSAETLGAMESAAELTQEYLKIREQFGRPLSTFQALAHRVTDMMLAMEQARSAVTLAATHLDQEPALRDLPGSACKNLLGRLGRVVAEECVQMHGGIGMTDDYALGNYVKRIIMADHRFGDTDYHLERFIELSGYTR